MGYYKGDFGGSGGYYRGDAGFFSFLGGLGKAALGAGPGVGPVLPGSAGALIRPKASTSAIVPTGTLASRSMSKLTGLVKGHPVLSAAGAAGALGLAGMGAARALHGRKLSTLARTGVRKKPRMNPTNPRALQRALRRAHAFERLAKHVIAFSSPRKTKGHTHFKRKRKK